MSKEVILNELEDQIINGIDLTFNSSDTINSSLKNLNNFIELLYQLNVDIEKINMEYIIKNSPKLNDCLKLIINHIDSNVIKNLVDEKIVIVRAYINLYNINTCYNDILTGKLINPYNDISQKELIEEVKKDNKDAKNSLILANEGLVKSVILKKFYNNNRLEYEDLMQEGRIGLLEAAERFNPDLGFAFSTYAVYYINKNIYSFIYKHQRTIKLPNNYANLIGKYKQIENHYMMNYGYLPSYEEISEELGISLEMVKKLSVLKLEVMSLDKNLFNNLDNDGEYKMSEIIADRSSNFEEDSIYSLFLYELKEKILASDLSDRNKEIILLRYGLYDGRPRTLKSLAKYYNVRSERIRQIIVSGLNSLGYDKKLNDLNIIKATRKKQKETKKVKS